MVRKASVSSDKRQALEEWMLILQQKVWLVVPHLKFSRSMKDFVAPGNAKRPTGRKPGASIAKLSGPGEDLVDIAPCMHFDALHQACSQQDLQHWQGTSRSTMDSQMGAASLKNE